MRPTRWLVLVLAAAAACASGESTGGQLTAGGVAATTPPATVVAPTDASVSCGSGGSKFSELYADIFGSIKPGGCVSESTCHGSADEQGALDQDGILCISAAGCRDSLLAHQLVTNADQSNPAGAKLFTTLRSVNTLTSDAGVDLMPKAPVDFVFSQACLDRISAWIANGAPND